ncbi:MAG: CPBP family intramembrane metalloprotease [Kineosporiaceae bacterium]|nr:CPBP family intramembrane metalloprotease [Kineosporiaceae bacterium]
MSLHSPRTTPAARGRTGRLDSSPRRRSAEAIAFVALWMAAGYLLPIDSNGYLLLGIPLTMVFQLFVRRRPLRELFAPATSTVRWDGRALAMAAALVLLPAVYAVRAVASQDWVVAGWYLAAVVGAGCAAFALRAGTVLGALRSAALPIAIGATGFALVYSAMHVVAGVPLSAAAVVAAVVKYTALYFPASFLLEEVSFRERSTHVHVHEDGGQRGWRSAVFVSVLWGLWHLPVSHGLPLPLQAIELVAVHVLLGVPLSFAWRRTRNLAGPALAHAVNDAVRNGFMLGL